MKRQVDDVHCQRVNGKWAWCIFIHKFGCVLKSCKWFTFLYIIE